MLPSWMCEKENYEPPKDGGSFVIKTIKSIGAAMAKIQVQKGHEKGHALPALAKLIIMLALIILVSVSQNHLIIMAVAALLLLYLCSWPAIDIWHVISAGLFAGVLAFLLFIPAMVVAPEGIGNNIRVVAKVFMSVTFVSIFNHTTQWNHITAALKKLHIPGLFIFTLDITLKYIVVLGTMISDLLTSLQLRSVGKNDKKYTSIGGVLGVTFVRGIEANQQMYEAMVCRGFTDDYEGFKE